MNVVIDVNIKLTTKVENETYSEKELDAIKSIYWLAFQTLVKQVSKDEFESEVDVAVRLEDDNTKLIHEGY